MGFLQDKNDLRGLVDMKTALVVKTYAIKSAIFLEQRFNLPDPPVSKLQ